MGAGCSDKVISFCICDLGIFGLTPDSQGKKTLAQL